jgi:hypothetical protein
MNGIYFVGEGEIEWSEEVIVPCKQVRVKFQQEREKKA